MNKKVFISMLVLTISFLVGLYVAKIFFPQEFMMSIQNENLIKIGAYIDNHIWLTYIMQGLTAFVIYWLFMCACKGRLCLNWKELVFLVCSIILFIVVSIYDANIASHIRISLFFIMPLIFGFSLKRATIIYTFHGFAQLLSLSIRSLPMYLTNINSITAILMVIECYLWLVLFYVVYNYKKKEI